MNNSIIKHIVAILVLPISVIIVIPIILIKSFQHSALIENVSCLKYIGCLFFLLGLILMTSTIRLFFKIGKGTLAPWNPTQKLVIQGPYKYCRNPMITGVLSILFAEALWFNNSIIMVWMLLFFVISTLYFFYKEEPDLQKRFGSAYTQYKKHVPRWIPKLKPYTHE